MNSWSTSLNQLDILMCSSEFNLQGTNMPLEQINRAIKQLEFLQSLPDQNKVVAAITDSLKPDFRLNIYVLPYFNQFQLLYIADWNCPQFLENYKYEQGNSADHKTIALMNVLIKARNHYELSTK